MSVSLTPSAISNPTCSLMQDIKSKKPQENPLQFEDFKKQGFKVINESLLRGTKRVHVFFHHNQAYLLAPCNVMTESNIHLRREFINFYPGSADELVLIYKETENKHVKYKKIFQDGTQMCGKGEHLIDEIIFQGGEKEVLTLQSIPLRQQLISLGFVEGGCDQALFQRKEGERQELIERHQRAIVAIKKDAEQFVKTYKEMAGEDSEGFNFDAYHKINEVSIKNHLKDIENLRNEKEWLIKVFTKTIPGTPQTSPKIFIVILKDDKLMEVLTSVQCSDPRQNRKIQGDIISIVEDNHFILENSAGERLKVYFESRDSSHRDYFTVYCDPILES